MMKERMFKNCLVFTVAALTVSGAVAADPDPTKPSDDANDPVAPYHKYLPAMASTAEKSLAAEWQKANGEALEAVMSDDALSEAASSPKAAMDLLAQIHPAYDTDPAVATRIAAVTQWVMTPDETCWWKFWAGTPHADGRKVWVEALLRTAETSPNAYATTLCLDQLRWCGYACPCVIERIRTIGVKCADKSVRDMSDLAVRALGGRGLGASDYPDMIDEGFVSLFNGRDLTGWEGATEMYGVETIKMVMRGTGVTNDVNVLSCFPERKLPEGKRGNLYTVKDYRNFVLRFEFCMPTNGNNGLGVRTKLNCGGAYDGMCELQLLDDGGSEYYDANVKKDLLKPYQYTGSVYGIVPSLRDNFNKQIWGKDTFFAGGGSYVRRPGMWNFEEVKVVGEEIEVYLNGYLVTKADLSKYRGDGDTPDGRKHPGLHNERGRLCWMGHGHHVMFKNIRIKELPDDATMADASPAMKMEPPPGFTVYFDGCPDQISSMWKGVTTAEKFDNPYVRHAATPEKREEMQKLADKGRDEHWHVRNHTLFFDGYSGGYSLATRRDYGDFEMWVDWRTMSITGDSGLYLRGGPQVQIWDAYNEWGIGSGGLFNNMTANTGNSRHALKIADRPVGDWNRFHIKMIGEKVTVWLNGELVVANTTLENFWDRTKRVLAAEQIELQCHGDPTEWRNIFIRDL